GRVCASARGIELLQLVDEGLRNAFSNAGGVYPAFFVSYRPHEHTSTTAITLHQSFELVHVLGTTIQQSLLIHHQHSEAVASIEQLGSGGVVTGAICIHSKILQ